MKHSGKKRSKFAKNHNGTWWIGGKSSWLTRLPSQPVIPEELKCGVCLACRLKIRKHFLLSTVSLTKSSYP
ncbi:hypothetical protein E2C01_043940 [Portunus trituberculatus]|uniref:Uncharacterized protein n=1 Tax=Portunus trituberculatus TaxID=210409 RepID=A0A5B7FZ17_PORTR|nr:hypothetical protein [Portunus trituberculatus]